MISGIFFGGAPAASSSTATLVKTDTTTSGSWQGVYGADSYSIVNKASSYSGNVAVTPSGYSTWTWFASTTDPGALQKAPPAIDRVAACWYSSTSFRIDLAFTDGNTHQIALYLLDYDAALGGRSSASTSSIKMALCSTRVRSARSLTANTLSGTSADM